MDITLYCNALATLLNEQDPARDTSSRVEGVFLAIERLAQKMPLGDEDKATLKEAIRRACEIFKQMEGTPKWPSNRFALAALDALGFPKPGAQT